MRSVHDELIDPRVLALNPWRTFGPRAARRSTSRSATRNSTAPASASHRSAGLRPPVHTGATPRSFAARSRSSSRHVAACSCCATGTGSPRCRCAWSSDAAQRISTRSISTSNRPASDRRASASARLLVRLLQSADRQQPTVRQPRPPARAALNRPPALGLAVGARWTTLSGAGSRTSTSCSRSPARSMRRRTTAEALRDQVAYLDAPEGLPVTRGERTPRRTHRVAARPLRRPRRSRALPRRPI